MPKVCRYTFINGMYQTECNAKLIFRPQLRCEKCNRRPQEKIIAFHREKLTHQETEE